MIYDPNTMVIYCVKKFDVIKSILVKTSTQAQNRYTYSTCQTHTFKYDINQSHIYFQLFMLYNSLYDKVRHYIGCQLIH